MFKKAGQVTFVAFVFLLILDMLFGAIPLTPWGSPPVVPEGSLSYASIGTTLTQIKYCVQGKPSSMILQLGTKITFLRPYIEGGWSIVMIDTSKAVDAASFGQSLPKAMLMSREDSGSLVTDMMRKGWQIINPSQLPPSLTQAVAGTTIMSMFPQTSMLVLSFMPTYIVDPCIALPNICGGIDG